MFPLMGSQKKMSNKLAMRLIGLMEDVFLLDLTRSYRRRKDLNIMGFEGMADKQCQKSLRAS